MDHMDLWEQMRTGSFISEITCPGKTLAALYFNQDQRIVNNRHESQG